MADVLERLKPLCSQDPERVKLATPFVMTFEGRKWAVATEGHLLAAIPYDGELRTDGPDIASAIPAAPASHRTTFATLRAWADEPVLGECDSCDGDGEIDHDCNCQHCQFTDSEPCEDCDGTGKTVTPRPTNLLDGTVNRDLISLALKSAPQDGEVTICRGDPDPETAAYLFRAPDWISVVLPIRFHKGVDVPLSLEAIS